MEITTIVVPPFHMEKIPVENAARRVHSEGESTTPEKQAVAALSSPGVARDIWTASKIERHSSRSVPALKTFSTGWDTDTALVPTLLGGQPLVAYTLQGRS